MMSDFRVVVLFASGTPELWGRVLNTPAEKLAPLSSEQKATAKRRGISEEDYQRSLLLQKLSEERFEKLGLLLGKAAQRVLEGLDAPGASYKLRAVVIEAHKDRWKLQIKTPAIPVEVTVPLELRDRILVNGDMEDQEAFKNELLQRLGRNDLIARR